MPARSAWIGASTFPKHVSLQSLSLLGSDGVPQTRGGPKIM